MCLDPWMASAIGAFAFAVCTACVCMACGVGCLAGTGMGWWLAATSSRSGSSCAVPQAPSTSASRTTASCTSASWPTPVRGAAPQLEDLIRLAAYIDSGGAAAVDEAARELRLTRRRAAVVVGALAGRHARAGSALASFVSTLPLLPSWRFLAAFRAWVCSPFVPCCVLPLPPPSPSIPCFSISNLFLSESMWARAGAAGA